MLEVEMKFPVADFSHIEGKLIESGARRYASMDETDEYFNAPDRDFAKTDEALRVRRIGAENYVTYKGPNRDAHTKTRTEIEVTLAPGEETAHLFMSLLTNLGYRPVAAVHKHRSIFRVQPGQFPVEVCLDEVQEVGRFAELEIVAPEKDLDAARKELLALAGTLGLTASERRSYLELLLNNRGTNPA